MTACRVPTNNSLTGEDELSAAETPVFIRDAMSLFFRTLLLTFFIIGASAVSLPAAPRISDYQAVFIPFYNEDGMVLAAVRRYKRDDHPHFLVLDPQQFVLSEMTAERTLTSRPADAETWSHTLFSRALARQTPPLTRCRMTACVRRNIPYPVFF